MRRRWIPLVLTLLLLAAGAAAEGTLRVDFFDVDKADAMLITFPDGARVMIDAGTNKAGKTLAQRFRKLGIETIDLMIITHFDKDHVGGADKILESCRVGQVLMPGYAKESKQHTQFVEALAASPQTAATTMAAREELAFTYGGAVLRVSAAHELNYGRDEENDFSLAARLTYGGTRLLFTGDAEAPRQLELLEEGDIDCDVLKVPYHGRAVETSAAFLSACSPKIAWIPDGQEEPASPELVRYLEEELGASVYCGSVTGSIAVCSDGQAVWVEDP